VCLVYCGLLLLKYGEGLVLVCKRTPEGIEFALEEPFPLGGFLFRGTTGKFRLSR